MIANTLKPYFDYRHEIDAWSCKECHRVFNTEIGVALKLEEHLKEHGGIKHDQDKVRYDLITIEMLDALAERLTLGARKYSDRNWELGLDYNRLYRGALGHLAKWFYGEDIDPEDGGSHLDAAFTCLGFLATMARRPELSTHDNRPKRPSRPIFKPFENAPLYSYIVQGTKVPILDTAAVPHGATSADFIGHNWCVSCAEWVYGSSWPLHVNHDTSPVESVETGPVSDVSTGDEVALHKISAHPYNTRYCDGLRNAERGVREWSRVTCVKCLKKYAKYREVHQNNEYEYKVHRFTKEGPGPICEVKNYREITGHDSEVTCKRCLALMKYVTNS